MYNIINICLVCVCNSIIIMTETEVELSYGRAIYERTNLSDLFIGRRPLPAAVCTQTQIM